MSRKQRRQQQLALRNRRQVQAQQGGPQIVQGVQAHHTSIQQTEQWTGPLPHPEALARFNEVVPGSADRIIAMAEREQAHRTEMQRSVLNAEIGDNRRGHYLGFAVAIAEVIGVPVTVWLHAPAAVSIALVSVPVLGIVRAFINRESNDESPKETVSK